MLNLIIRTFIIYCSVTFCMRLMGKKQLGQLQPAELVITMIISEIATNPIENPDAPLSRTIIPLLLLVCFEIFNSYIDMKNVRYRLITEGNPVTIIKNGVIDQKKLKSLRFTISDVIAGLRQKDIFDITEVDYAIVEANGSLSVLLKPKNKPLTPATMNKPEKPTGMPCPVMIDGKIIKSNFCDCGITVKEIQQKLMRENLQESDVVLMTVDKSKKFNIITKTEE